jgi:hypothetical protein
VVGSGLDLEVTAGRKEDSGIDVDKVTTGDVDSGPDVEVTAGYEEDSGIDLEVTTG